MLGVANNHGHRSRELHKLAVYSDRFGSRGIILRTQKLISVLSEVTHVSEYDVSLRGLPSDARLEKKYLFNLRCVIVCRIEEASPF